MAIRKPSNEIGRGNQDPDVTVSIPPNPAGFTFEVPSTWTLNNATSLLRFTVPQPGTAADITIDVVNDRTDSGGDIIIANGARIGAGSASNIANVLEANSNFTASVSSTNTRLVTVTNATGGIIPLAELIATPTNITGLDQTQADAALGKNQGTAPSSIEEPVFKFNGPFTNIAPNKAPIQGMARVAMAWHDWLLAINAATTSDNLNSANSALRTSLAALVPTNAGIPTRTGSALRKIAIRGSRRDSNGMVGRGKNDLNFVFINETADYSLRQLVVRIFDAVQDIATFLVDIGAGLGVPANFTNLKTLLGEVLREFSIEIGELERAIGRAGILYENTIVNNSSDQGLLLYSDELADAAEDLTTLAGNIQAWGVDVGTSFPVSRRNRLLLKN